MRRRKRDEDALLAEKRAVAEDDVIGILAKYEPAVAHVTALRLQQILSSEWKAEQEERLRLGDQRKAILIVEEYEQELAFALTAGPRGVEPDAAALDRAMDILHEVVAICDRSLR